MAVLVIADHDNASLKDSTNKTITAALALSGDVDVLVAGKDAKAAADARKCSSATGWPSRWRASTACGTKPSAG